MPNEGGTAGPTLSSTGFMDAARALAMDRLYREREDALRRAHYRGYQSAPPLRPVFVDGVEDEVPLSDSGRAFLESLREEEDDEDIISDETPEMRKTELKKILKSRHLSRAERLQLHKPDKDWVMTKKGEVCKSTSALVVDDLAE